MKLITGTAIAVAFGLCSTFAIAANRSDAGYHPANPRVGAAPDGGGSCATPVNITSLPFSMAGNTCGGANNITNYTGTCGLPFPYGGPDDVWAITVGAGNSLDITASLTGSAGDLALFLLSTCGSGTSCLANSQDAVGAGVGPEIIPTQAGLAAGTYYIYVDSYYDVGTTGACGTYTLAVAGVLPVSLESFRID